MKKPTPVLSWSYNLDTRLRVSGFTLIELLTVIAIIGILAAIIIPITGKVRESARQSETVSRMRAIGLAAQLHVQDNKGNYMTNGTASTSRWPIQLIRYFPDAQNVYQSNGTDAVYENPLVGKYFKCTTQTSEAGAERAQGVFGLNNRIAAPSPLVPVLASKVSNPSKFILFGTTDGIGEASGGLSLAVNGPAPKALTLGYVGATAGSGLAPNFGTKAVMTFADGHVKARSICNAAEWPWTDRTVSFEL